MDGDAEFWAESKAAGFLVSASTILPGCTRPTDFDVRFGRPDANPMTGVQSSEYEIEYQHSDAPTLVEGAQVLIDETLYRVRQSPYVEPARGDDGYFRTARLTREST